MSASLQVRTASAEDTRSLGEAIAALIEPGDVVSLTGDLGAGKTTLVQGLARALDVREPVVSPTFTLVRQYRGRHPIYHLDIYRLDRVQDVIDLGFEEMADDDSVVFVEWGDAIEALLPESHLQIELSLDGQGDVRTLEISAFGPEWARRWDRLAEATRAWGGQG
jgi:tRNA threonylcarbamoyladenosine biosynthesis protein TsaE